MADELSTSDVIENINTDMNESGEVNDFVNFSDVELDGPEDLEEMLEGNDKEEPLDELDELGDEEPAKEELDLKADKKEDKVEGDDEEAEVKMLNGKLGEDAIEINPDTMFTHTVDGKEVEVSAQELLNDYSGRKSWNSKFSELGEERKSFNSEKGQFTTERDQLTGKVNSFVDAVNKSDAVGALESLASLANANPVELRKHFISLMEDQAKAYVQLSPEDQRALDNQVENKYHQDRSEYLEGQLSVQQDQTVMTNQISGLQSKYGIDDEKLIAIADELKDKSIEMSIEALEESMSTHNSQGKASDLLTQIDPSLKDNTDYIQEVGKFILQNPDLSEAEIMDSIKDALDDPAPAKEEKETSSASKKIQNRINKNTNSKKVNQNNKVIASDSEEDMLDFDDVMHDFNY